MFLKNAANSVQHCNSYVLQCDEFSHQSTLIFESYHRSLEFVLCILWNKMRVLSEGFILGKFPVEPTNLERCHNHYQLPNWLLLGLDKRRTD
jgi:hypothetical protein